MTNASPPPADFYINVLQQTSGNVTFHKSDVQIVQQCDLFIYLFNLFNLFKIQRSCELRSSLEAVKLHYFLKFQFFSIIIVYFD